ncbi:hypothetical protein E6H20_10215 [Candidatus Bathyarchaeota archaeon]|nr:MAG: hypothetical protein E6H20_10215 [Candidatus Bathyarchaeota archaeon]
MLKIARSGISCQACCNHSISSKLPQRLPEKLERSCTRPSIVSRFQCLFRRQYRLFRGDSPGYRPANTEERNVSRVYYDTTPKPPGTIEFE